MRMDQLEYFTALASFKTIQAVSEKYYTSPQVVSKAIKQLETELNTILFMRTRKGMDLTEEGHDVYPYVEEILNNYNYLKREYIEKTQITMPALNILSAKGTVFYFSNFIKSLDFNKAYAELTLTLKVDTVQEIQKTLYQENAFDIIGTVCSELELEKLYSDLYISRKYEIAILNREPLKLLVNKNTKLPTNKKTALSLLKELPLIKYNLANKLDFDRYLEEIHHIVLKYPIQVNELPLAMELLEENKGCFFATEHYIANVFSPAQRKRAIALDLEVDFFEHDVLLFNRNRIEEGMITRLLKLLRETLI